MAVIGKIGLTPKGEYNPETVYEILDVISNNGNSYVSRIIENNQPLSNTEAWMLCAEKGEQGIQGIQGIQGDKGDKGDTGNQGEQGIQGDTFTFDDLTTAQKEELKGDVIAYNSLTEADKSDLASRVPTTGVIEEGNTQAVSGDTVYKENYSHIRTPFVGVTKYGVLAAYINDNPRTGAICLKTPFTSSVNGNGFFVLNLSVFDLDSGATNSRTQKIKIGVYISGGSVAVKSSVEVGDKVITSIRTAYNASEWVVIFNSESGYTPYRHIILDSVEASFGLNAVDLTNGFSFDFITSTSGMTNITSTYINYTITQQQLDKCILKRTPFAGVTDYINLTAYINDTPRTGTICLKTPFGTSVNNNGFFNINLSVFDLNSSAVATRSQKISIPAFISGGVFGAISSNSTGDSVFTNIKAMLDENGKWVFVFNLVTDYTPYRHVVLESVETSFGLNAADLSAGFSFDFITSTSGWGSEKDINISYPLTSKNIITDDSFNILSRLIVNQAKITKNTITGNVIISGDSTIDNVYGFDAVADYMPIIGNITDIATGGDDIAAQVVKWNAISTEIKNSANYVFVEIGINDLRDTTNVPALLSELQDYINLINSECPNAFVVIATITPYYARFVEIYGEAQANVAQQKWVDYNEGIKGNGSNPITGVDAVAFEHTAYLSTSNGSLKDIYNSGDQLHENNLGRLVIAQSWINTI